MWTQIVLFAIGLLALYFGAEWLVRGAARLARSLGVSALVVGLTVVAFGTSAPELVVSLIAAARGQADVAIGNVVGSNILNIALILGASALICPLRIEINLIRREVPIMIAAALALAAMSVDGTLGRGDAILLLCGFAAFNLYILRAARRAPPAAETEFREFEKADALEPTPPEAAPAGRVRNLALIAVGIVALVAGAQLLVGAALFFARAAGVSELVIGLTIIALGTSLPELATSLLAAIRRESDIAIGNVVGSNIFNILSILGISAAVRPIGIDPALLRMELPIMIGVSAILLPFAWTRLRLERWEGALLIAAYVAFTWLLIARGPEL